MKKSNIRWSNGKITPMYDIWQQMKQRCINPKNKRYKDYGGRGIAVCERWLDFDNFCNDMGAREEGSTLERIDNDKGYDPENCKWVPQKAQNRNKRSNRVVVLRGESLVLVVALEKYKLLAHKSSIISRLNKGYDAETAFFSPFNRSRAW